MNSYRVGQMETVRRTKFERLCRLPAQVQESEIAAFLGLDPKLQFEKLRELRRDAAHLSGGSFGALIAIYTSAALVAYPLISSSFFQNSSIRFADQSLVIGSGIACLVFLLAMNYALTQNRLARSATRLAFYEEALRESLSGKKAGHQWQIGKLRISWSKDLSGMQ
jgi:hypothetical protein